MAAAQDSLCIPFGFIVWLAQVGVLSHLLLGEALDALLGVPLCRENASCVWLAAWQEAHDAPRSTPLSSMALYTWDMYK
jgi:hypothetical protein